MRRNELLRWRYFALYPDIFCPSSATFPPLTAGFLLLFLYVTAGVGELTAGERRQLSNRLNFPFIYYACDSLYFKSKWNESDLGMAALDASLPLLTHHPCAICELSFSTRRHTHLCHTAPSLVLTALSSHEAIYG